MASPIKVGVGVGTLLLRAGKFLLGKRHDDSAKASSALHGEGTWTMPGGKIDFGETYIDAAKREIREETGIEARSFELVSLTNEILPDAHFITVGLLCTDFSGEPRVMEPDEMTEWRWFPLNEPPSPMFFPSAKILKNYLAKKIYNPDNL